MEDLQRFLDINRSKRGEKTILLSSANLHKLQARSYDILSPADTSERLRTSHKPTTVRTYV